MSMLDDFRAIINKNITFVLTSFPLTFRDYHRSYKYRMDKNLNQEVFDMNDYKEVRQYLKKIHKELIKEKIRTPHGYIKPGIFEWIQITEDKLTINHAGLKAATQTLWNKPIDIEEELKSITPHDYSIFMQRARYTIRRLTFKIYSKQFNKVKAYEMYPFIGNGYEWFLKIEKDFNEQKGITVKYTMIYEFLIKKNLLLNNFDQYRNFIIEKRTSNLNGAKFSRRADTTGKDFSKLTKIYSSR